MIAVKLAVLGPTQVSRQLKLPGITMHRQKFGRMG